MSVETRETVTLAGKFAEALGNLEDALCWLGQVNEQYMEKVDVDDIPLLIAHGPRPCSPAMDFWLQAEKGEDSLKDILRRLQRVEPLAPKEVVKA